MLLNDKCAGFIGMSERGMSQADKKWMMCPTCRQPTEYGNVAFVDDEQKPPDVSVTAFKTSEASVTVNGSYSTKVYSSILYILFNAFRLLLMIYLFLFFFL